MLSKLELTIKGDVTWNELNAFDITNSLVKRLVHSADKGRFQCLRL